MIAEVELTLSLRHVEGFGVRWQVEMSQPRRTLRAVEWEPGVPLWGAIAACLCRRWPSLRRA